MNKITGFFASLIKNPAWVVRNLFLSLTNDANKGFSYKKLSACIFLLLIVGLHVCLWKYQLAVHNFNLFITVLATDMGTFGALIGISTLHQINLSQKDITVQKDNSQTETDITGDVKS